MQGEYDEQHAQMMRALARQRPYAPFAAGGADHPTYEQEERRLVELLRTAVRERFGTSRRLAGAYEALRRGCGTSRGADERFESAVRLTIDQAVAAVLEEALITGRAYEITAAYLDQHLRNALLEREGPGRKERPLSEDMGNPAGAWDVPEALEREARQREEHRRLIELLLEERSSPALATLLRLWDEAATAPLMGRLCGYLLPAGDVAELRERLEGLLADFDDLRRDVVLFPRAGPGAHRAGLLLDAWLSGWDVYAGGKMKFYDGHASRHGLKSAASVSNWLTALRKQICSRLDLRSRDGQGRLTRVNDHELAEALVALTHRLTCPTAAPPPAREDKQPDVGVDADGPRWLGPEVLDRLAAELAPEGRPRPLLEALRRRPPLGEEGLRLAVYGNAGPEAGSALFHDLLELHAVYARLSRPPDDGLEAVRGLYHSIQRSVGAGVMRRSIEAAGWEKADESLGVAVVAAARNKVPFDGLAAEVGVGQEALAALLARMRRLPTRNRGGAGRGLARPPQET